MENVCPCKGCIPPKRSPTCHSTCIQYAGWKVEHDEEKERILSAKKKDEVVIYFGTYKKKNINFYVRGENKNDKL